MPTIWSIGHGTRSLDDFLALLRDHEIAMLADVRSFPGSRRYPHFGQDALAASLRDAGVAYAHLRGLGGRRREIASSPHRAIQVAAFRAYADHMATDEFRADLARLEELARAARTAFMCSETLWWRCHRRLLSDQLTVGGWEVVHIVGPGKSEPHRLWDIARREDDRLIYDVGTLPLDEERTR